MKYKKGRRTFRGYSAEIIYKKHIKPRASDAVFYSNSRGGVVFEKNSEGMLTDNKFFVDVDDTAGAMNGDEVAVRVFPSDGSACVLDVTKRMTEKMIGTIVRDERYDPEFYLEPEDSKIRFEFAIVGSDGEIAFSDGDKAEMRITYYPEYADSQGEGIITQVFGNGESVDANYKAVLYSHGIQTEFSDKAIKEAKEIVASEIAPCGRVDLRDELIITLDGADAKDLDDAISVKRTERGYILGVHIADVSHYVRKGSAVDAEAYSRGTSVYFTDKVVPMLPKEISNGICSLDSGSDKYALSAMIELDRFGEIKACELKKSIIRSKIRGVYSEFNSLVSGEADDAVSEKYSAVIGEPLETMLELYRILRRKNEQRGALELESSESAILLGADGLPTDIILRDRGEGERLIEQFMLCANEAVAMWLTERDLPCVYRVHEAPNKEKVTDFVKFSQALGISTGYVKYEAMTPAYFGRILDKARALDLAAPVSYMLLRTMSKAKYSEKNIGHFGLASKNYCHFTSPIRRYPDLAVHRIISLVLEGCDSRKIKSEFSDIVTIAKECSETEIRAMETERDIEDLYKCLYLRRFEGEELDARISSVTSFGIFCMTDFMCEGLVPLNTMPGRFYFDKEALTLTSNSERYKLGDRVKIKVAHVDISARKAEFWLVRGKNDTAHGFGGNRIRF